MFPLMIELNNCRRKWIMGAEQEWDGEISVPIYGIIHEWWSRPNRLPPHWVLCDGTAGTSDLRVMADDGSYDYDMIFEQRPFAPANYIEYRGPISREQKAAICARAARMLAMGKESELT